MKLYLCILAFCFPNLFFAQNLSDTALFEPPDEMVRKQIIKINLMPALGGRVDISWELALQKSQALDAGLNMIGLITQDQEAPKGFILHAGYKIYFQHRATNQDKFHPLSGFYIEPMLLGGYTEQNTTVLTSDENLPGRLTATTHFSSSKYGACLFNLGSQYIFFNRLSLDFTGGLGLGTYSKRLEKQNDYTPSLRPQHFGFAIMDGNNFFGLPIKAPVAMHAGIRVGYVFN